jgi:acetyl-CoA carboxylase carboxyl transferase subunit alpha
MAITSGELEELGLIDDIVTEPRGGAHRDPDAVAASLKQALLGHLDELRDEEIDRLLARRYERVMGYARYKE